MRILTGPWPDTEEPVREVPLTFALPYTPPPMPVIHEVRSRSSSRVYKVFEYPDGTWSCPCPDYEYRRRPAGEVCKHIDEAMMRRAS